MKGQLFVGVTFLVLIFLIAGQYYEIHHLRVANQTFRQHTRVIDVETYAAGMTEAVDQQNHELTEMLSQTLWATRRLGACIQALELQHQIAPPFQDDMSFNYISPRHSIYSAWKPPVFDQTDSTFVNVPSMDPMFLMPGQPFQNETPLVFYESYQPHDPNSLYYVAQFGGGENTLDYLLACLKLNTNSLNMLNSEYRKLIQQYDARIRVLYNTLKEKKLLGEPENPPAMMGPVF
ncbi:MAG TPA: hypothetical protein PKB02_10585 [Anaerohalosphaeraceae bacterium]|nr:hypothetical protein [Anaerohalosphaeraceae bacterium]